MRSVIAVAVLLLCITLSNATIQPFFKVLCAGLPLFRGRADTIVSPGIVSNHVHRVAGGSNFGVSTATTSNTSIWSSLRSSTCNTCSLKTVDNSAYWHPDLFYKWPNGTLSLVPQGGLTVYYESRSGTGSQANIGFTAFPPGFRMISGNPFKRTYNASNLADQAISFACLPSTGSLPQTPGFPAPTSVCTNGLRAQVYFPSCWDGVNLDSPSHSSHVAFPDGMDNGNCPPGFPKRIPGVFFEAFYSVSQFPTQSYQPFVLACGDSTGYGFHGDFLNGWDQTILQEALQDSSCDGSNTNGNSALCNTLAPYVVTPTSGGCPIANPIPLTEDLGMVYAITKLPGCQTITGQGAVVTPCSATPQQSYEPSTATRFMLVSKSTGKYVTAPPNNNANIVANLVATNPSLTEVFAPVAWASGSLTGVSFIPEAAYGTSNFCSAAGTNGAIQCNRQSASTSATSWEAFQFISQAGGYIAIKSLSNGNYVTVQSDGSLAPTSTTVGTAQLFTMTSPDGGHI